MTDEFELTEKIRALGLRPAAGDGATPPPPPPPASRRRPGRGRAVALAAIVLAAAAASGGAYLVRAQPAILETLLAAAGPIPAGEAASPRPEPGAPAPPSAVAAAPEPVADRLRPSVIGSGYVVATRQVVVKAQLGGRVVAVEAGIGERVRAGDPLVRLDDRRARADLAIAEAELARAESAIAATELRLAEAVRAQDRIERLLRNGSGARVQADAAALAAASLARELDIAGAERTVRELLVEKARADLDAHVVAAPFAGIVATRGVEVGEIVSGVAEGGPPTPLALLLDPAALAVDVDVAEANLAAISAGQRAVAELDARPDARFPMSVAVVFAQASPQRGTVPVRLVFDRVPEDILPNMSARITFLPRETVSTIADDRSITR